MFLLWFYCQAGLVFEGKEATLELKGPDSSLQLKEQLPSVAGRVKIPDDAVGRITAALSGYDNLIFSAGQLDVGSGDLTITGSFLSGNANPFFIGNSTELNLINTTVTKNLTVTAGQIATISGLPLFSAPITLANSSSELRCRILNKLDQNIILNSGKVTLENDLAFKDANFFLGSGTIDINHKTLLLPAGNTVTGALTFLNAKDIQFTGNQTISAGTELFSGVGLESLVNGNGYIWNIINDGKIQVGPNHKLYLTDIHIKNLGDAASFGYFDIDATSTVVLSGVTLELGGNYTHGAGTILVEGDACFVVSHGNTFTVQNANTRLRVDGVALGYRISSSADISPFVFVDQPQHRQLVNDGTIRASARIDDFRILNVATTPTTLTRRLKLSSVETINFTNASPGTPKPMIFDGGHNSITFPNQAGVFFHLDANVQLTLQNIVLEDFNPAAIDYAAASSTITFGDGVLIKLAKDINIAASDRAWNFIGTASIDSQRNRIIIDGTDRITLTGASKKLTLKNSQLLFSGQRPLTLKTTTATLALDASILTIGTGGYDFYAGNLDVVNQVNLQGSWAGVEVGSQLTSYIASQLSKPNFLTAYPTYGLFRNQNNASTAKTLAALQSHASFYTFYQGNLQGVSHLSGSITWNAPSGEVQIATATAISTYDALNMGVDGCIWFVRNDNAVFRLKLDTATAASQVSASLSADGVAVGNKNNVYAWNSTTGTVYQCSNPTSGTPTTWVTVTDITFPRSLGVGSDGTVWYINSSGAVYKKVSGVHTLIHSGDGRNFQRISAYGTASTNYVSLLDSPGATGRALISKDNSAFYELGIPGLYNFAIGSNGAASAQFDNAVYDQTLVAPHYDIIIFNNSVVNPLSFTVPMSPGLIFSSAGNMTIKSGATLTLTNTAVLQYKASPAGDGTNTAATKRHLVLEDSTSTLKIVGSTLTSTDTGLALTQGNFIIKGDCTINSSTKAAAALEFASAVNVRIKTNATANFNGPVLYG